MAALAVRPVPPAFMWLWYLAFAFPAVPHFNNRYLRAKCSPSRASTATSTAPPTPFHIYIYKHIIVIAAINLLVKRLRNGRCATVLKPPATRYRTWTQKWFRIPVGTSTRVWLGWAYLTKKVPHAATMPIVTAVVCFLSTQNMGSWIACRRKLVFRFLTRFLYRAVTSRPIYRTNQRRLCK